MVEVAPFVIALMLAELRYYEYVENNGIDGSSELQQLTTARNSAAAALESRLVEFVDNRIAAAGA